MRQVLHFFDKLEDRIRGALSHHPVPYSLMAAVAIVVFWDGISRVIGSISWLQGFWGGVILIVGSVAVLLLTGVFVSFFIGDTIIISGIRREKKTIEKTEEEIEEEMGAMRTLNRKLDAIEKKVDKLTNEKVE
jgi:hypothetical protein